MEPWRSLSVIEAPQLPGAATDPSDPAGAGSGLHSGSRTDKEKDGCQWLRVVPVEFAVDLWDLLVHFWHGCSAAAKPSLPPTTDEGRQGETERERERERDTHTRI
jgi:hypothetical protein